jgi:ribonuclease BN (tRNA processing enzyme)
VGQVLTLGRRRVEVLPAAHTVPAVGYAVLPENGTGTDSEGEAEGAGAWVFTGDTGPNTALWQRLATLPVRTLVIETAFRDEEHALAEISGHLSPARLKRELAQLSTPADVWITHIKPGEVDAVMAAVAEHGSVHRVQGLKAGQVMALG